MKTLNKDLAAIQLSQVIEQLNSLADWLLINIYTNYADENRYEDIHDLSQDTINDLFESPWDAITKSNHDGFNENDSYFVFNGYGLMSTFTSLDSDNCPIDVEELAQWLINEDKLADYDIAVTTLDDMLASIEGNISDDSVMLNKLGNFLMVDLDNDSYEDNVYDVMTELNNYTYEQIQEIIIMLGINYE